MYQQAPCTAPEGMTSLSVATWNLENLFRPAAGATVAAQDAYQRKLAALAATIASLAPDVIALQEVGDAEALDDLRAELTGTWHQVVSPDADRRGIRVAFLSRLDLDGVERVRAFPPGVGPVKLDDDDKTTTQMGRGALRVRVGANGTQVDIVTAHLKSKLLSYPGNRFNPLDEGERARFAGYALALRAAEAITLRGDSTQRLQDAGETRPLIVLGDLNDEPLAATTQMLLGPPGSVIGSGGFGRPDAGDRERLWNLAPLIPEARRFTRRFEGRGELIDHILVSGALVRRVTSVDTGAAPLPSVTTNPGERQNDAGSDHAPVIARFAL
jgi:endonuclease/exonuclease/phosphatase family metal-dependent hydrolase